MAFSSKICSTLLFAFIIISSVSTNRSDNNNSELLKSLRERPGSVLVIHVPQVSGKNSSGTRALRFDGEWVHRYVELGKNFVREDDSPQHYSKTREQIPANVTAAFTGPDREIYFFRGDKYCKRPLLYRGSTKYCLEWQESHTLFGCNSDSINSTANLLCVNATVDGVASNKSDLTNRIKFLYQGNYRWILTIGSDGKSGNISFDEKYQPRKDKNNKSSNLGNITLTNSTVALNSTLPAIQNSTTTWVQISTSAPNANTSGDTLLKSGINSLPHVITIANQSSIISSNNSSPNTSSVVDQSFKSTSIPSSNITSVSDTNLNAGQNSSLNISLVKDQTPIVAQDQSLNASSVANQIPSSLQNQNSSLNAIQMPFNCHPIQNCTSASNANSTGDTLLKSGIDSLSHVITIANQSSIISSNNSSSNTSSVVNQTSDISQTRTSNISSTPNEVFNATVAGIQSNTSSVNDQNLNVTQSLSTNISSVANSTTNLGQTPSLNTSSVVNETSILSSNITTNITGSTKL